MSLTAEIQGGVADRYRAYTTGKSMRRPTPSDHSIRAKEGKEPYPERARIRYDIEHPAVEAPVTGTTVNIDAGKDTINKVVFYHGPVESEVVVGSVDVNVPGTIEINLVKAPELGLAETEIFDE